MSLSDLPNDILSEILSYLHLKDLFTLPRVSTYWRSNMCKISNIFYLVNLARNDPIRDLCRGFNNTNGFMKEINKLILILGEDVLIKWQTYNFRVEVNDWVEYYKYLINNNLSYEKPIFESNAKHIINLVSNNEGMSFMEWLITKPHNPWNTYVYKEPYAKHKWSTYYLLNEPNFDICSNQLLEYLLNNNKYMALITFSALDISHKNVCTSLHLELTKKKGVILARLINGVTDIKFYDHNILNDILNCDIDIITFYMSNSSNNLIWLESPIILSLIGRYDIIIKMVHYFDCNDLHGKCFRADVTKVIRWMIKNGIDNERDALNLAPPDILKIWRSSDLIIHEDHEDHEDNEDHEDHKDHKNHKRKFDSIN